MSELRKQRTELGRNIYSFVFIFFMADTLALRRRIKTAQNISKTTRAMQMIAASKLKKAQTSVVASRPYVDKLGELTLNISPKDKTNIDSHPYMQDRSESGKTLFIFIGPDKGLCGGMVTNLIREYFKVKNNSLFVTVGKKMQNAIATSGKDLLASFAFGSSLPKFEIVFPIIDVINQQYLQKNVDKVKIVSTHFNNVFSQTPVTIDLLPVIFEETKIQRYKDSKIAEFTFEPSKQELLTDLLKRYIEMVLYQQFLESYASYNAAQMIAMQNATNNAKDIVSELQLLYNKARQEKITKEILDISSASVALARE